MPATLNAPGSKPEPGLLEAIRGLRLAPLVGEEALCRIAALTETAGIVPRSLCLETRLTAGDSRVDAAFCLHPGFDRFLGPRLLGGNASETPESWGRARHFLMEWKDGALPFPALFAWLAFDLDGGMFRYPEPCVSVCVDRAFYSRRMGFPARELETWNAPAILASARHAHARLLGRRLPKEVEAGMRACLGALGKRGYPKHLSFMLSRNPVQVKLDVCLPIHETGAFLRDAGMPEAEAAGIGAAAYMPWPGQVQLNLVMDSPPGPNVDAEFLTIPLESMPSRRLSLLEALVKTGLCEPAKAEILRRVGLPPGGGGPSPVRAGWHVKVRFRGARACEAKAYLGYESRKE